MTDPMTESPPGPGYSPGIRFTDGVRQELAAVRRARAGLAAFGGSRGTERAVLAACVLANAVLYLVRPDYFGLFIAASFYLNMYYFILLIIPTKSDALHRKGKKGLSRVRAWLKDVGIRTGTSQFSRLFTHTIFMNSRALSLGIGLIFVIDILFSFAEYSRGLPAMTTAIVIAQCSIIVIFYLLVWKVEPFSSEYAGKVERLKVILRNRSVSPQLVAGLLVSGFVLSLFLFLITIIFLPGITLHAFLDQAELAAAGYLFALLAILAVSQYFPVRFIHGFTSRTMAERILAFRENSLCAILETETGSAAPAGGTALPGEDGRKMYSLFIESGIYAIRKKTIAGLFPVWVVDLDLSVMTRITAQNAIRGYIRENRTGRRR